MAASGQTRQHDARVLGVGGFAQHLLLDDDDGVGGDDGPLDPARFGDGARLLRRQPSRIVDGRFL